MVVVDHQLPGRVLRARRVYRQWGRLWLVLELPDGGVTSVEVGDTDVLAAALVVTGRSGHVRTPAAARRSLFSRRARWVDESP